MSQRTAHRRQQAIDTYLADDKGEDICRHLVCSQSWLSTWRDRSDAHHLAWVQARSTRPTHSPTHTPAHVARAIERDETAGLMKVVVDADTDKILGAAILSAEGGELVQILGFVMLAGASYKLLKGAVYIHPTLAEGLWTLMEEVKAVE